MRWKKQLAAAMLSLSLITVPTMSVQAEVDQQKLDTMTEVYRLLAEQHYTHPAEDELLRGAIEGMLSVLDDAYTQYMTPDEYADFLAAIQNQYGGVGIGLSQTEEGRLLITKVYPGSPAEQAGLAAGDFILSIDGKPVEGESLEESSKRIRGLLDTEVVLVVSHGQSASQSHTLTRSTISLPSVYTSELGDGIGYLGITTFSENTTEEFLTKLSELQAAGHTEGLVLDLRGNGGGYVISALEIADHLLRDGTLLVYTADDGQKESIAADSEGVTIPVVVLVDGNTASASEILAGALQKNGRAQLVGVPTFGKGTMQAPYELSNGGVLKVSVDRYEFGDGTSPDKVGLTPDLLVKQPDFAVNAAVQVLRPDRLQELVLSRKQSVGLLNGQPVFDMPSTITAGERVYLPLRYVVEALGHEVRWLPTEAVAEFELSGRSVRVDTRRLTVTADGKPLSLTQPVRMENGSTYLSGEAFAALTGQAVNVTEEEVTVQAR